jgi:hypothetical protein
MKIRSLTFVLLLAAFAAPAAASAASTAPRATLLACHPALASADRSMTIVGTARARTGEQRVEIRFDLQRRHSSAESFARLSAPGLGVWNVSRAGVRALRYVKTIDNLAAPSGYRALVRFRFRDSTGHVVRRARRTTAVCRQPDLRPDLHPVTFEVQAASPTTRRYVVTVVNRGATAAGAFAVGLSVDGIAQPPQSAAALAAGERTEVAFEAPRCTSSYTFTIDPDAAVDEADETDDVHTIACLE